MKRQMTLALVGSGLLLCGWAAFNLIPTRPTPSTPPEPKAHRTKADSIKPEAEYVGMNACADCHVEEFRSFRDTAHANALAEVDPANAPADAQFDHPLSGRSYRVYRAGGLLRHRQWLTGNDDSELIQDFPVKYAIGSGRHGRGYVVEDQGFLIESPISWFESRKAWGMSPGYDRPNHGGFERSLELVCVNCHVGRVESVGGAPGRYAIHERMIGCESCHGPGSRHAAAQRAAEGPLAKAAANDVVAPTPETIVNPGRLARELSESICARCHMRGEASVYLSDRGFADFRPGRPLSEYRIDYKLAGRAGEMKVGGHIEQLHLSRCYEESATLSCTTCHDPHRALPPERAAAEYRNKCLECHAPANCGLTVAERIKTEPGDSCVACHMPQSSIEIPHVAFTQHRIGIHPVGPDALAVDGPEPVEQSFNELTPLADVSRLTEIERDRCLGLAYLEHAQRQRGPAAQRSYSRGVQLLESVRSRGLRDACVDAGLARVYGTESPTRAMELAVAALENDRIPPSERTVALAVLGVVKYNALEWESGKQSLQELVGLRRHPVDWTLLGLCQIFLDDEPGAIKSLRRAAEINPYQADLYVRIARLYEQQGQNELAQRCRRLAQLLEKREQERTKANDH